jgi:hypothetical protein
MKSKLCSVLLQTALLTVLWSGLTIAQAGDKMRPGNLDYGTELPQGSLMVYSATDEFNDGGVLYYAHSSYVIYTTDGTLFKSVENHISRNDETPEIVTLPIGSYIVEARSERKGYVRVRADIKAARRTTLVLDSRDKESPSRIAYS